jgi:hypothetical protein
MVDVAAHVRILFVAQNSNDIAISAVRTAVMLQFPPSEQQ